MIERDRLGTVKHRLAKMWEMVFGFRMVFRTLITVIKFAQRAAAAAVWQCLSRELKRR